MRFVLELQHAVLNSTLPAPARHLLLAGAVKADWATGVIPAEHTPSLSGWAAMTGLSKSTVAEWFNALETSGWLKRERATTTDGRTRTRYTLLIGSLSVATPPRVSRRSSPTRHGPATSDVADLERAVPTPEKDQPGGPASSEPVRQADAPSGPPGGTPTVRLADRSRPPGGPTTFLNSPTESSTSKDRLRGRASAPVPRTADESGSRLPQSFRVTDEMADWARQHAPHVPRTTVAAFIDYWTAQPDSKGRRCDWTATWRNWMRREQAAIERHPGFRGTPVQTVVEPLAAPRPIQAEVCSKHRGQRAGSCGLCRAERIAADTG